ncbi:MAG: hypothetical protein ACLGGY_07100 [Gammaproteobacteria bacterium]
MKWLAGSLLVLNLMVAGWFVSRDYLPRASTDQHPAMNVDRLSLRSPTVAPPAPARSQPAAGPRVAEAFCVEWRGLNPEEFVQVREQLKTLAGQRVMSFTEVPLSTRRWVIFPPLPSVESAVSKLNELTAAGVQDAFVVRDAAWRNAISLGLFANDEAAGRRVRELESKGVLGTRVEVLPRQGTEFYFVIRSEDPDALKSLGEIRQAHPNSQQSRVACPS